MSKADELKEQGIKLFQQHDYEAATRLFQQAREAYQESGDEMMAAEMKVNIGVVHRSLGEHQHALDSIQEALATFQEAEDALRVAQALGNLGGVYTALGDKEQAYNSYRQAADIFEELGEKDHYSETLLAMGDLQVREGKILEGAATYQIGLEGKSELSASQKIIKRVSGFLNRLNSGS